jgi:hypothetical protein
LTAQSPELFVVSTPTDHLGSSERWFLPQIGSRKCGCEAMGDFDKLTKKYAQVMEAHGHKKEMTVGSIFFSIFTGELLGAVKEGVVSFREVRELSWKKVSEMKCAPGGVVYHFSEAMGITA